MVEHSYWDPTMGVSRLNFIYIRGTISIEPTKTGDITQTSVKYAIMGPTGAGKSNFIEALAGDSQNLSISKDQLAGYTQEVAAYRLVNVTRHNMPLYLIDTPGFCDSKISEIEIMDMVRKWLKDNDLPYFERILYLIPITDIRLAGSRRRTINMLKAFLKPSNALGSIVFVTTMWDTLPTDRAKQRAESNFAQLQDDILKEFIDDGAHITTFMNAKGSAVPILDRHTHASRGFSNPPSSTASYLYRDLHQRIENTLHQKKNIELDLFQPESQTNQALRNILEKNHRENEEILAKFVEQFFNFGPPPSGFEDAHQRLQLSIEAITQTPPLASLPLSTAIFEDEHSTPVEDQGQNFSQVTDPSLMNIVHSERIEMPPLSPRFLRRLVSPVKSLVKKWLKKSSE